MQRPTPTEMILWPVIFLVIVAYGLSLLRGGYMHYEGQFFLAGHLDGRGLFQKVFSTHFNNWDCYQARELSFFFGLLDSQAIVLSARAGLPLLYSLTSIAAIIVTAVMLWRLIPRIAPRLSITDAGLLVSLMLVTSSVELSSYYYRPGKALVAAFLVLTLSQAFRVTAAGEDRSAQRDAALLLFYALLLEWTDLQGVFFVIALMVVIAAIAGVRTRSARLAQLALLSALITHSIWHVAIGPKLSLIADGFPPATTYDGVPLRYTFGQFHHYGTALSLWLDNIGHFFGSSGKVGGAAFLVLIGVAYWMRPAGEPEATRVRMHRPFLVLVVVCGMLLAMYTAMYAKLTSIAWPESRMVYYWIPSMVVVAIVASIALDSAFAVSGRLRTPVSLALGLMICTSVFSLPRQEEVVRNGEQRVVIAESGRVRDCMATATTPIGEFRLTAAGAQACSSVRIAAFGSAGPGPAVQAAVPNPLLWCPRR